MSTNIVKQPGWTLSVICDSPATPASGDPVRFGAFTGVAETAESDAGNATGYTSVYFGPCIADVSVKAVDGSGNSAVALGDAIFYVDADTPKLSKKSTGYLFGFALEAITSGSTDTINVMKVPTPGAGTLAAGSVGTTQLAASGVTAAKLSATLKTGFVPLPLTAWRLIATNDVAASGSADGGTLSLDTAPKLKRVNAATDKKLRVEWAASSSIEITQDFVYPPDIDEASVVTVKILAASGGATNSPTVAVGYFENVGDTNAGGNTGAVTGTSVALYSVQIAASDVGAVPAAASVTLTPAAHTTDALYIYGTWIEYTRA